MKLTAIRAQCGECKAHFNSVSAFDAHRTGDYGHRGLNRRCRTPDEMRAAGMLQNAAGFWITRAYCGPDRTRISGDLAQAIPTPGVQP